MDYSAIEQLDLFVAGFPCQSFSLAGKRKGFDEVRGTLFFNCAEFIRINQPKYFILENVKGLLSHDKAKKSKSKIGRTFSTILNLLSATVNRQTNMFPFDDCLGYNVHYKVLNSVKFGVPQNRERVFIIGIRKDLPNDFRFPIGFPLTIRLKDILEPVVDEKYYLSDKMLEYMMSRSANFNNGKINYKDGNCIASTITRSSSSSIDISDNIIIEGEVTPNSQAGKIYGTNGISPTISAGTHRYALGYINEPQNEWTIEQKNTWKYEITCNCGHVYIGTLSDVCPSCNMFQGGTTNEIDQKTLKRILVSEPSILVSKRTEFGKESRKDYESGKIKLERNEISELYPREDGISNTISTVQKDNLLIEPYCVAMRGRNPENSSDRTTGAPTEQRLEPNSQGITNTITSVQKDNLIVEPKIIGYTRDSKGNVTDRHIKDEAGTIHTSSGSGGLGAKTGLYEYKNRIRRLTPKECMRLQGFSDDYISPCSDTQRYKMAGNSITVNVIKAVIKNLLHI